MAEAIVRIEVESIGQVTAVRLLGEHLDASNSKEFRREITPLLGTDAQLVFVLKGLQFVDSSGLGAILSCLRTVNAQGGQLKLCELSKNVRALFELVRMHRVFDVYETLEEAVASYGA